MFLIIVVSLRQMPHALKSTLSSASFSSSRCFISALRTIRYINGEWTPYPRQYLIRDAEMIFEYNLNGMSFRAIRHYLSKPAT